MLVKACNNQNKAENKAIQLFAVVNGEILQDLGENLSATYTRIHYLLNGLREFPNIEVNTIKFRQFHRRNLISKVYNNLIKTVVAIQTSKELIENRPAVYFAYPHSLTTIQSRFIFRLCELLQLNIILDIHDTIEQANAVGSRKSMLKRDLEGHCVRRATLILALNRPIWRYLEEKYQIPQNKLVAYVPNACEESFFKIYTNGYKSVENRFNICYIGGLTKNRGIDVLVQACIDLHKKYPYLKLYLFGPYGEGISPETKHTIESSSFIIRRAIPRKDLPAALQDVDLFVMPYDPTNSYMNFSSPTKLFEYIGTGKPILCTKCESLLDIGKDGSIIYVDYDAADIEKKAELLINNPRISEEMSKKLLKIRPCHSWKERAERFYGALRSLCETRPQKSASPDDF